MTAAWLALAAAVLLAPLPSPAALRVRSLAGHESGGAGAPSGRRSARPPAVTGPIVVAAVLLPSLLLASLAGPLLGVAAGVVAATGAALARSALRRRAADRRELRLLTAVRLLVAEIEAGARPAAALAAAGGVARGYEEVFAAAAEAAERGEPVAPMLLAQPELAPLGHAWRLGEAAGAPLADTLAGVCGDLAGRRGTRQAVVAAVAGARSSAGLLAGLPVLGIVLGTAMGAHPWTFLTGSPAGRLVACAGAVLDAVGVLWTQRLVGRALPRPAGEP